MALRCHFPSLFIYFPSAFFFFFFASLQHFFYFPSTFFTPPQRFLPSFGFFYCPWLGFYFPSVPFLFPFTAFILAFLLMFSGLLLVLCISLFVFSSIKNFPLLCFWFDIRHKRKNLVGQTNMATNSNAMKKKGGVISLIWRPCMWKNLILTLNNDILQS